MKTIYQIARKELKAFFYSPIAWVALIVYVSLIFLGFIAPLSYGVGTQENGQLDKIDFMSINFLFGDMEFSLFKSAIGVLGFIMPLLTMSLMSRELSSGSIKLLYSSPISTRTIVLGKFLAMVFLALIVCSLLAIYIISAGMAILNFEYGLAITGLTGVFLLICTMSAIGLFVSSLTRYQLAAALGTLAIFMLLRVVATMGQTVPFVRNIAYWLSMESRAYNFAHGMVSSRDVIYFITLPAVFLALTVIRIDNVRFGRRLGARLMRYGAVCAAMVGIALVSTLPRLSFYRDATRADLNTVTKTTQGILGQLDGPVTFSMYQNLLGRGDIGMPNNYMRLNSSLEPYTRFKPDIDVDFIYYYDTPPGGIERLLTDRFPGLETMEEAARRVSALESFNFRRVLSPEEIREKIDLSSEDNHTMFILGRDNGQRSPLRMSEWGLPSELSITTALNRFIEPDILVGFLEGGRSITRRGILDYYDFANSKESPASMINLGFQPETVSLDRIGERFPKDMEILVIADLDRELPPRDLRKITEFIDRGGNLLIACEPGGQSAANPLLAHIGFEFEKGRLVQKHLDDAYPQNLILATYPAVSPIEMELSISDDQGTVSMPDFQGLRITMPEAVAIRRTEDKGFHVETILTSDTTQMSWTEYQTTRFDDAQMADFNPETGERSERFDLGVALSREVGGKQQRIVILGDADCFSMSEIRIGRARRLEQGNEMLFWEIQHWLTEGRRPLSMQRDESIDNRMTIGQQGIQKRSTFFRLILPGLILAACIIILFRRKSK